MRQKFRNSYLVSTELLFFVLFTSVNCVEDQQENTPSNGTDLNRPTWLVSAVTNCLPLITSLNPDTGPPSTWFSGTCQCSKAGDASICPEWSYVVGHHAVVNFSQAHSVKEDRCVAQLQMHVISQNLKEEILLKCKVRGFRSVQRSVVVQKVSNGQTCFSKDDCRYPQQECFREYDYSTTKTCKCPDLDDFFDPQNPDVCFKLFLTESSSEQVVLICVGVVVALGIFIAAMTGLSIRLGTRATFTEGGSPSANSGFPFWRQSNPHPTDSGYRQVTNQGESTPPPSYHSVILSSPPPYESDSRKDMQSLDLPNTHCVSDTPAPIHSEPGRNISNTAT